MMRTPSLRRRVTGSGVAVFLLLVLLLDAFVYVTLRARLEETLDDVLATRVELARDLDELFDAEEIADGLGARGVPAVVTTPDGRSFDSEAMPRFEARPPTPPGEDRTSQLSSTVELSDGGTVEVFVSRGGVDSTLRRVLVVSLVGTLLALLVAVLLFRRAARVAMAPLEHVIEAARRTAAGTAGERLEPDEPGTELGRFATAYDTMLDSLEDAVEQTRASEERTRRFLDDAAHQLRTPLTTVRASVEALLREDDPEVRDQLMASLVREVARADRLLTSLLTLARLDAGSPPIVAPVDLRGLCRDEADRCRSMAPHLEVEVVEGPRPGPRAAVDEHAVRDVVANLLDNARRHAASRIEVAVATDGADHAEVRVSDDGPGVPDADVERVFHRFTSLDGRGGSGLGLPIGRAIAQSHGGSLTYEAGSFVLRLPLAGASKLDEARQA